MPMHTIIDVFLRSRDFILVFEDSIPNSSVNFSSKGYFKSSIFLDWLKSPA